MTINRLHRRLGWAAMGLGTVSFIALTQIPTYARTTAATASPYVLQAEKPESLGSTTYQNQCSICHQPDRKGLVPTFPSLVGVTSRLTDAQIKDIVHNGRGRMPAQPTLEPASVDAVIAYIKQADADTPPATPPAPTGTGDTTPK